MAKDMTELLVEEIGEIEDNDSDGPRRVGCSWTELSDRAWNGQPFRNFHIE